MFAELEEQGFDVIPHTYIQTYPPQAVNQRRAFPSTQPEYVCVTPSIQGEQLDIFLNDIAKAGLDRQKPQLLQLLDHNLALQLTYCNANLTNLDCEDVARSTA